MVQRDGRGTGQRPPPCPHRSGHGGLPAGPGHTACMAALPERPFLSHSRRPWQDSPGPPHRAHIHLARKPAVPWGRAGGAPGAGKAGASHRGRACRETHHRSWKAFLATAEPPAPSPAKLWGCQHPNWAHAWEQSPTAPLSLHGGPAPANPPPAAGAAQEGAKPTLATHKPCRTWNKPTSPTPRLRYLCLGCKRDAYCPGISSGYRMSPQPSAAPQLPGTARPTDTHPFAPLSIPAKDGRAHLSLLLRANYPSISLGKDSGDVCKISIH